MEQNNYKIIKDSFFYSYKSFVDFITLSNTQNKLYNILILRKKLSNSLINISIIIRSTYNNNDNSYHELTSNMILNNIEAINLIKDIKNDFIENHEIAYSSVNPRTYIQTLQNTKFTLNIKLINNEEYEEAINFNNTINKHKVLVKV